MKIREMFKKPIDRDIKGVIKVGQKEEENIKQELEEYVVTNELQKHFRDFFSAYGKGISGNTDDMGVWISGFFGSGKSHLLKILSYLLSNKEINGKKAIDYFLEDNKIKDEMVIADMKRACQTSTDSILFNIDSKSESTGNKGKDDILKVFLKVFNEMQGFSPKPHVADLERELVSAEKYEEFKEKFKEILNETEKWLDIEIGSCNKEMYISDTKSAQLEKHSITSFINKIQKETMDADISACCLFEVMPGFGKKLRYRDIILNYPFPNTLVLKEMSGQNILDYLTQLSTYWIVKDNKIDINPKFLYPKREMYNYDLLDGIEYTMNISKSGKNFISDVKVEGEDINLEKKYKLVLNNYRATGGGNFSFFPELKTLKEDTRDIAEVLIDYVKENNYVEIEYKNNIKLKIVD